MLEVEAYRNAVDEGAALRAVLPPVAQASWRAFRRELRSALGFRKKSNTWGHLALKQPFGIFAESGERLASVDGVVDAGLILVSEGGQWFWPPMRLGYVRKLLGTDLMLETLSVQPVLYRVRGFLHGEECAEIVRLGQGRMVSSPVSLMDKDQGKEAKEFRTSTQARVASSESRTLQEIDQRVSTLTRIPTGHNEEVQILRYQKSQYYSAHMDNWDPQFYSGQDTSFMEYGHNNRLITVFWYLTNVTEGGETLFPRAEGLAQPPDMYSCAQGLKVRPEQGSVIFWYSLHPNGNTDPNGLHAACPVELGEKWSANHWVWNKPRRGQQAMPDAGVDDAEEDDVGRGSEENAEGKAGGELQQVTASFKNEHPKKAVHLFWRRPENGEDVAMGIINPGSQSSMNTFPGHIWTIRSGPNAGDKPIRQIKITKLAHQVHVIRAKAAAEEL